MSEDPTLTTADDDPEAYWRHHETQDDTPTNNNGHPKTLTQLQHDYAPPPQPREDGRERTYLTWHDYRQRAPKEVDWLIRGLIPAGGFAVIGSTPKAGKTWFLTLMAICAATGKPFLGRFIPPQPIKVHYLALEGSAAGVRHRIGCLARGLGIDPESDLLGQNLAIDYKPPGVNLTEPAYAAWYCEEVMSFDARLCLIDTARRAARIRESGDGVQDLQLVQANLQPLTRTGRTPLFAHHSRKMQTQQNGNWTPPLERLSGSGDWGGLVEVGIVLDRRKGTEWRDTRVEIDGRDTPAYAPMRVVYEGDGTGPEGLITYDDALTVRVEEDQESDGDSGTLNAAEVAKWLSTRPRVEARTSEIAEHFGVHNRTIQRHHSDFKRQDITWNTPARGVSRSYWLSSPIYSQIRTNPDTRTP